MTKCTTPGARVIGLDPDTQVLEQAAAKAKRAGVTIEWQQGYAHQAASIVNHVDKAVSSLVFHQTPLAEKRAGLAAMVAAVPVGGEIHIADYARQPDQMMRRLFRTTVQRLDGFANTQPNADGALESILSELAGRPITPETVFRTPTGAISLFKLTRQIIVANESQKA